MISHTILVADDSSTMRQLIDFTLQGAGYKVIEAKDGKDAINKIKTTKIDIVISDLNMPNLDGLGLLKHLRGDADFKAIPVVMLTTESELKKVIEAKKAGINGWIIKPFEPIKLIDTVKRFLS